MRKTLGLMLLCLTLTSYAEPVAPGAAIATASPYATRAGMNILKKGGNAFDAAIAITAVLAVTEPYHSGIGGGGFWLLKPYGKEAVVVDGREVAPLASSKNMYLDAFKRPIKRLSLIGPMAAAIPGEPAALVYMSKHYAKLSLAEDLAPAIHYAENGFKVDNLFHHMASISFILKALQRYPASSDVFLRDGEVPKVGTLLKQKDLANTLKKLAAEGSKGFYEGKVANKMVRAVRRWGGIWQTADLKNYKVKIRKPLIGHYKGTEVITVGPPSAGGIAILTMLNILQHFPLDSLSKVAKVHYILEAMRLAYWDRAQYLGDADFVNVPIKKLLSDEHVKKLMAYIQPNRATSSTMLGRVPHAFAELSPNTTHFSVIDVDGNAVSATMSINFLFGSAFVAEGTGVLLNDEMDDFSIKPGVKNIFGLVGSEQNAIAPGKRPLSSMSPTILIKGDKEAVIGTPGGSRIPTMLLLATLAFADGKHPYSMVSLPRFHHQYLPDIVKFEEDALSLKDREQLKAMGYHLRSLQEDYGRRSFTYGDMQAVMWDKKMNAMFAASDPRKVGLSAVFYRRKGKNSFNKKIDKPKSVKTESKEKEVGNGGIKTQ